MDDLDLLGADAAADLLVTKHARHAVEHKVRRSSSKAAAAADAMDVSSARAVKAGEGLDELLDSSWLDGGSDAAATRAEQAANMHRTEHRTWQQQQHANMSVFDEDDMFAHTHAREAAAAAAATAARAEAAVAADDLEGSFPVSPVEGRMGSSPGVQHWPQQRLQQHLSSNILDEQLCTGAAAGTHAYVGYGLRSSSVAVSAAAAEQQQQQVLPDIDISLQDMATPPALTAAAARAADDICNQHSMASGRLFQNSDDWLGDPEASANQQQRRQQQQLLQSLSPTPVLAGSLAAVSADSPISFQGLADTQLEQQQQQQQCRLWQQQDEQPHQRKQQQQLVGSEQLWKTALHGCSSITEDRDVTSYGVHREQRLQERSWQLQQDNFRHDQQYQQQQQQQQRQYHSGYYDDYGDELDLQLDDDPAFTTNHQHHRRGSSRRLAATSGVGSSSHAYAAELNASSPAGALEDAQKEQELEALLLGFNSGGQFRQQKQQQGRACGAREGQLGRHQFTSDGLLPDVEWRLQREVQDHPHWQQPRQCAAGHQLRAGCYEMGEGLTPLGARLAATAAAAAASTAGFGVSPLPSVTEGRSFMNRLQQLLDSPFDGAAAAAETASVPAAVADESVASGLGEDHHQQRQRDAVARQQALQQELLLLQQQQRLNMQQSAKPADSCETVQQLDQGPEECSRHEGTRPAATAAADTAALPGAAAAAAAPGSLAAASTSQQNGRTLAGRTGNDSLLLPFNVRLLRSASPQPKRRRRYATSDSLCSNKSKNATSSSSSSSQVGRRLRWSGTAVADLTPPAAAACKHASAATAGMQSKLEGQQQHPPPQQQNVHKALADMSNSAAPKGVKAGGTHMTRACSGTLGKADDSVAGKPAGDQQQQQPHVQQMNEKQRTQKANASVQKRKQPSAGASLPQQKQLQQARLPFLPVRSTKAAAQADQHAEAAPAAAAAATASATARMPDSCTAIKREDATAAVTIKQEETWHATPSRARLAASAAAIGAAAAEAAKLRSSLSKPRQLQQSGDGAAGEVTRPRKHVRFADVPLIKDAAGLNQQQQQQQQQEEEEHAERAQPAEDGAVAPAGAESAATALAHEIASVQAAAAAAAGGAAGAKAAAASTAGAAANTADISKADATAQAGAAKKEKAAAGAAAAAEQEEEVKQAAAVAAAGGAASGGMFATAGPSILSVDDLVRGNSGSLVPGSVSRQQLQQAHTLDQVIEGLFLDACAAVSTIYCQAPLTCVLCCLVMCMGQQFHAVMPCMT
jgi:hypothetical protein